VPIIVGGTCYYALGLFMQPEDDVNPTEDDQVPDTYANFEEIFQSLEGKERDESFGYLLEKLDPVAFNLVKNNPKKYETYLRSYFRKNSSIEERNKNMRVKFGDTLVYWITSNRNGLNSKFSPHDSIK
jgi:tRNA A37 N6-isopentenylltransferase MiaA